MSEKTLDYTDMTVADLRDAARDSFGPGSWIATATKAVLLRSLESGQSPVLDVTPQSSDAKSIALAVIQHLNRDNGHVEKELLDVKSALSSHAHALREQQASVEAVRRQTGGIMEAVSSRVSGLGSSLVNELTKRTEKMVQQAKSDLAQVSAEVLDRKLEDLSNDLTIKLQSKLIKEVVVKRLDGTQTEGKLQHKQFKDLLDIMSCKLNAFLVGPAAAGKTRAAEEVASALNTGFYPQSFNSQTPSSQLFGYMDANGHYVRTVFRDAFEKGGIWLADEIDRANGNVLTALNSALENGYCSFPDGVIKRHDDFLCIASANTWGRGADRMYVGANALDEATLNRFVQLAWEYDEDLERIISGNLDWATRVQAIRKVVMQEKVRTIVSPRASIYGAKLLKVGFKRSKVEDMLIWKGMDEATVKKVLNQIPKEAVKVKVEMV